MTQMENRLRELLEQEGASLGPASPWRPEAIGRRAVGLRRRRRLGIAAAAAVPVVAAGTVWFAGLGGASAGAVAGRQLTVGVGAAPAGTSSPHMSPVASASAVPAAPPVKVVASGAKVPIGYGQYMVLTRTQRSLYDENGYPSTIKSVTDGNQPQGTVGLQSGGAPGTRNAYYSPLYIGPGRVARITLESHGHVYEAQVVTLAGHPGYATGYVWIPATAASASKPPTGVGGGLGTGSFPIDIPTVKVYDVSGKLLASL